MIKISQGGSAETDLINSILKTGNIVDPINSGVNSSFILYQDEWNWIKDYYDRYREVPPQDAFMREFSGFPFYKTSASIDFYIEELHKHKARRALSELLTEAAGSLKELGPYNTINVLNKRLSRLGKETLMVRDLDLVNNADDRLENLKERIELLKSGKEIIGVPTGIKVLDYEFGGWQRGDMITIAAWTGNLKCLAAGTLIAMSDGTHQAIENVKPADKVLSYDGEKFVWQPVLENLSQGTQEVYEVKFRTGKTIKMTANHPLLTSEGWKKLEELSVGDMIVSPRAIPNIEESHTVHSKLDNVNADRIPLSEDMIRSLKGYVLRTNSVSRAQAAKIFEHTGDTKLEQLLNPNIYWDEIVSVESAGFVETYDLSMPEHHNFVANNILVHNSYLALYTAMSAWQQGYRILYFSLEMSSLQIGYRFDSLLSQGLFSHNSLTHAREIHFDRYKTWLGENMKNKPPFVVVTNEDLEEINQNTVSAKIDQWSPHLVIIDYVQLMDEASGAQGETEKLKNLSKSLKRLAIKTGVPIIVITSVTPKDRVNPDENSRKKPTPPQLDELAWSKQLAFDSDLCLSLLKQEKILEVVSRKNRRGGEIHFNMKWDFETGEVKELSPRVIQEDYEDEECEDASSF